MMQLVTASTTCMHLFHSNLTQRNILHVIQCILGWSEIGVGHAWAQIFLYSLSVSRLYANFWRGSYAQFYKWLLNLTLHLHLIFLYWSPVFSCVAIELLLKFIRWKNGKQHYHALQPKNQYDLESFGDLAKLVLCCFYLFLFLFITCC